MSRFAVHSAVTLFYENDIIVFQFKSNNTLNWHEWLYNNKDLIFISHDQIIIELYHTYYLLTFFHAVLIVVKV